MINPEFEESAKSATDETLRLAFTNAKSRIGFASLSEDLDMNLIEEQRERLRIVKAEMHRRLVEKEGGEPVLARAVLIADITIKKEQLVEIHLKSAKNNFMAERFVLYDDLKAAGVLKRTSEINKLKAWLETADALSFLNAYDSVPIPTLSFDFFA